MGMDIRFAPAKCYLHDWYGSLGMRCPVCQAERDPPIRRTDVIEWSEPSAESEESEHG